MASWTDEAAFGFVLCGLVYLALLVGWRTRAHAGARRRRRHEPAQRVPFSKNGGDWTLGELALWTAFLPLGRRFSVDAVRASLRGRPESTAAALNDRAGLEGDATPVRVARRAGARAPARERYFFNAVHKGGMTWRTGSAVHYVIYQDRM